MMLELRRKEFTEESTIGDLYINGKWICHTLEDPVRKQKINGITAIPAGTYKGVFTMSYRFKKILPLILDVQNFAGIRIHSGNTAKDTEGCILVGLEKKPNMIWKSRDAMLKLQIEMKSQPFTLVIF